MEAKLDHPYSAAAGPAIKIVIGAFFIALGVLLTLDNLDVVYGHEVLRWWPLVLVVIGAIKFVWNAGRVFGVILMIAGAWMTALNLGLVHFTLFDLWPLIFIGVGVILVGRAFGWNPKTAITVREGTAWSVLSSRNIVETSRDFTGIDAIAFLGGCQLDLSRATITRSPAVVDATAIWGGMQIIVPDDWEVVGEVVPVLGGFEIKAEAAAPRSTAQLIVRGVVLMGGIEVKSVRRPS